MCVASPTFGAALQGQRTSTTWFLRYRAVQGLVAKASALLCGADPRRFEEPQLVRSVLA